MRRAAGVAETIDLAATSLGEPTTGLNLHELSVDERLGMGIDMLPGNLLDATRELEQDDILREALGMGRHEAYVDYFVKEKRQEFQEAHEQITQWEIDRYLQLY